MPGDALPPPAVGRHDRAAWRRRLLKHAQSHGVWLVTARKRGGRGTPGTNAAVEESLCFGWTQGGAGRLDERRSLPWFTPRKPWSACSRRDPWRVEALEAAGLMHESGQARVDQVRRPGLWHATAAMAR